MAEYIEKQAAIKKLCHVDEYNPRSVAAIKEMKPADVRPVVRGRWIPRDLTYGGDFYVCSVCDRTVDVPTAMWVPLFRFCPHCGSDMEDDAE